MMPLRRNRSVRTIYAAVLVSACLSAAAFYTLGIAPLHRQLTTMQERTIADALGNAAWHFENVIDQHRDLARLTASRSKMREDQIAYLRGKLDHDLFVNSTRPKLADALYAGEDLLGAVRLAPDGTPVFAVGEPLDPEAVALCGETEPLEPFPIAPIKTVLGLRVVYCSPILDTDFGHVGNDVLLFGDNALRSFLNVHTTDYAVPALTVVGSGIVGRPCAPTHPRLCGGLETWLDHGSAPPEIKLDWTMTSVPGLRLHMVIDEHAFFAGLDEQLQRLLTALGLAAIGILAITLWALRYSFRQILAYEADLGHLATHDRLTGLCNRHEASHALGRLWASDEPFAVILVDIDHFKAVNDHYGHAAGDAVLKLVASACTRVTRADDVWARYGGEEFLGLLPDTDAATANRIAERLRHAVEQARHRTAAGDLVQVTVSAGVATRSGLAGDRRVEDVVAAADAALYASKHKGRNRISMASARAQLLPA
ncbi:MAG: GGDEF domain-containing protein [Pseudomonadota bacterium]